LEQNAGNVEAITSVDDVQDIDVGLRSHFVIQGPWKVVPAKRVE
jgi:hypothetical protein